MTYPTFRNFARLAVLAACGTVLGCLLVFAPGCKPAASAKNEVTGRVTYKGAPVTGGQIDFQSAADPGLIISAVINPDGTYGIATTGTGSFKVTVSTDSLKPTETGPTPPGAEKMPKPQVPAGGGTYVAIPAKYSNFKTTTLTYDIKEGKQTHDFDLTD
ncbi:MAG TPA: hypothetical protein VGZ47_12850 [Gemmataceae bacterium]|jgi:hypothetical protein|nr:hypothetical protein [Gemmataceae bacterium]